MGERSELFWLRAIASLAEVIAPLSISEAEQARQLVVVCLDIFLSVCLVYVNLPKDELLIAPCLLH